MYLRKRVVLGAWSIPTLDGRIVGGKLVDIKDHPYQLSLQHDNIHYCGAALIRNNIALTAAHCVSKYEMPSYINY